MATFQNQQNGYTQSVGRLTSFLGCLIFGCFYFAYRGVWKHFLISGAAAFCTVGVSWFIYPFFAYSCVTSSFLERGWRQVGGRAATSPGSRRQSAPSFDAIDV